MSQLFELYAEGILLKNQELHDLARKARDERRIHSTIVARTMREIQHRRTIIIDIESSLMSEIKEKLFSPEQIALLPTIAYVPPLPASPLFLDLGETVGILREVPDQVLPFRGMMFQCPGDRKVLHEARELLSSKYHSSIEEVINRDQSTWTLSCVDSIGEEIVIYHYRLEGGAWIWSHYGMHHCPFGWCRSVNGAVETLCGRCETIKNSITLLLGIILLYDSGYYQEAVVAEEPTGCATSLPG